MNMGSAGDNVYLRSYLSPLAVWLEREDVTDIFVNRPGEIWIETLGAPPERIEAPDLTSDVLYGLVRQIAAISAQGVSREYPLLAASLPGGERIQAAIPPATRGEIALAIRKHVVADMRLCDYQASGAKVMSSQDMSAATGRLKGSNPVSLLAEAVQTRRNIVVSGGTSSGKTTLINALLREIPPEERLVLIEDTPELQLGHENAIGLVAARGDLGEAAITTEDLLTASIRLRPDRIILGELRGSEAITFLRAANTGHPGSITSIHADNPERAIDQLALLVAQTGIRMGWDDIVKYVHASVDVIVQLRRCSGRRDIESVLLVERQSDLDR